MRKKKFDPAKDEVKKIYRKANINDVDKWKAAMAQEKTTMYKARIIATALGLRMKLSDVEFQGDKTKAIFYYTADVSNYETFKALIENIEVVHGKISGVIHAAGNVDKTDFRPLENLSKQIVLEQFSAKIQGTINIYSIFENRAPNFVWITSSLSSILGGMTFGAYAVANAFIDCYINSKKLTTQNWFIINLDGVHDYGINNQKLIEVFEKSVSIESIPQIIVSLKDPNFFLSEPSQINFDDPINISSDKTDRVIDRNILHFDFTPPYSIIEKELCSIIESFFGYKEVGVLDNFFDLGGDSLKAMTMTKRINKIYEIEINIQDFYSNPCVRDLSKQIELAISIMKLQDGNKGESTLVI